MKQENIEKEILERINNGEKLDLKITDIKHIPSPEDTLRIRKLTERECGRLMGVKDEDITKIMEHQTKQQNYHLFGDSIVTTCLMAIFGELMGVDYKEKFKPEEWWGNE